MSQIKRNHAKGLIGFGLAGTILGLFHFVLRGQWLSVFCGVFGITWLLSGLILKASKGYELGTHPTLRVRFSLAILALYGLSISLCFLYVHFYLPNTAIRLALDIMIFLGPALSLSSAMNR